jgi:hypothetical protein
MKNLLDAAKVEVSTSHSFLWPLISDKLVSPDLHAPASSFAGSLGANDETRGDYEISVLCLS